jgi:ParB-like chromosome segregation protein Spo0J
LKVTQVPIDSIFPYKGNPRINEGAVDKVAASIREFGFRQPIVVDKKRVIIVGHTRWLAAKKLDLRQVPIHIAAELPPAKVRAYRLADNRTHEESSWDQALLIAELAKLSAADYDLSMTGFDLDEITALLAGGGATPGNRGGRRPGDAGGSAHEARGAHHHG